MNGIYKDYNIDPLEPATQALVKTKTDELINFLKVHTGTEDLTPYISSFNVGANYSNERTLMAAGEWSKFTFAASVLGNAKDIVSVILSPMEIQMANAGRPTKSQLLTLNALKNVFAISSQIFEAHQDDIPFIQRYAAG